MLFSQQEEVFFHPNKGQWDNRIQYKVELQLGEALIGKDCFIYNLNDGKQVMSHHHEEKSSNHLEHKQISCQIIKAEFIGSSWKGEKVEQDASISYRNYFIGNDKSKWASKVFGFQSINLVDYYPNIDLELSTRSSVLKYSFIVNKGGDINKIRYKIDGANRVSLNSNGTLTVLSRFGEIEESKPIAWNIIEGKKVYVDVSYRLKDNQISYFFPNGYNKDYKLIIDPSITFSTFSGSTADNWGMTATPDNHSNLYAAGIVFVDDGAYPATTGAFDIDINGGELDPSYVYSRGFDVAISKFSEDGSQLLFASYLGGSGNETPHSLVVDQNDNLYLLGATSSSNFPTTSNAFDVSFNGGSPTVNNNLYFSASDIYIAKVSSDGSELLSSTYVGGNGNDGLNTGSLDYNYGDSFRGEIIHGKDGFIYVSSTTKSSNFPTVSAFQNQLKGLQDAAVFKISDDLKTMAWSSYFGGSGYETGNSIQKSTSGDLYFTGGTSSTDISNFNGHKTTFNGGLSDGYLIRLNSNNGNIINSTFVGDIGYDQAYFVQLDSDDNVYVYGQTETNWPITSGLYGKANSGQFIRKYSKSLSNILWTTMVGAGTGYPEISPTAFLVSNCDEIYFAGWGGNVNHYSQAIHSTTSGFDTTPDAFQPSTSGSNFYIAVLSKDAASLKYGTFMGGYISSSNHVDGGTSRFDKNGKIYHAVCAACGGDPNGFTSTPNVFSSTNKSPNCNLAAFKFELNSVNVDLNAIAPQMCISDAQVFYGITDNGNAFQWDFGDGTYSTEQNPTHEYITPGNYVVTLTISDTISCFATKTVLYNVEAIDGEIGMDTSLVVVCAGKEYQMNAFGGDKYEWKPTSLFNNAQIGNPLAKIYQDTTIEVVIENLCGIDTFSYFIPISKIIPSVISDTIVCENQFINIEITNSVSQIWSPATNLDDSTSNNPIVFAQYPIVYQVDIYTQDGCLFNREINVDVNEQTIDAIVPDELRDISICIGEDVDLYLENTISQLWTPQSFLSDNTSKNPTANPTSTTTFYITAKTTDLCYLTDSLTIEVFYAIPTTILVDTLRNCVGDSTLIFLNGAELYDWSMNSNVTEIGQDSLRYYTEIEKYFYCDFINACGTQSDSILVVPIVPKIYAGTDTIICPGEIVGLWADSMFSYKWYDSSSLIANTMLIDVSPLSNSIYKVIGTDLYGCIDSSEVSVELFEAPKIKLMNDYLAYLGEFVPIDVYTLNEGIFEWFPKENISCNICPRPFVNPNSNTEYTAVFTDTNGCKTSDKVLIYYDGIIYVPNSFTPNVDGKFNTQFNAEGLNIVNFEMQIFDRWGELVFKSSSINTRWDGIYNGKECQTGTYIWKILYTDVTGQSKDLIGHVNLIR